MPGTIPSATIGASSGIFARSITGLANVSREVRRPAKIIELELRPGDREQRRGDRTARDGADPAEVAQLAELVDPPDRAEVEEGRPDAAA